MRRSQLENALLERLLTKLPYQRAPRFVALFVLTGMACWGEPGAKGPATAADVPAAAPGALQNDESEPVSEPAPPPTPLPPQARPTKPVPTFVPRPAPSPASLASRVAPKLEALSAWVKKRQGELGFALRDLGSGRELLAEGAGKALNPASNQKLLTTAVALSELGADFRYHVGVLGKVDGGVAPRLVLRSDGDPTFTYEELRGFAERLVGLGLKQVAGDVLVDQSAFDDRYTPPAFEQQPSEWAAFRAPVSAVSLERNSTTLHVFPTQPGELARVEFEPPGYVSVQGEVRTERGKKRDHVGLTMKPHGLMLGAQVSGDVPAGGAVVHITRRIDNPEIYAGVVLKRVLQNLGVEVRGEAKRGGEDETGELVGRDSLPLSQLVQQLGKASDNFYAETLLKTLGAVKRGKPGTAENGAQVAFDWLRLRQLGEDGLKIGNGSGLYDANRVSARTFTRVLEMAYLDPAISQPYQEQLAVGGLDGTLRTRFYALKSRRSVHAKTGTLNKVTSLSGYVFGPEQETGLAFSILVTGTTDHAGARQRMDALVLEMSDALWAPKSSGLALARR
ncbi:MAG: D-alanyl-D-alanine carboxypeptidase/D-alanyl-D-alanine-endopeptidase [Myxococcales bacterium]|nr:MAG: D-alanyl-D-alanine carboxypeptidase/D-alanyl-D-alanine-endopeptidase [Myxococcales bacterium]